MANRKMLHESCRHPMIDGSKQDECFPWSCSFKSWQERTTIGDKKKRKTLRDNRQRFLDRQGTLVRVLAPLGAMLKVLMLFVGKTLFSVKRIPLD